VINAPFGSRRKPSVPATAPAVSGQFEQPSSDRNRLLLLHLPGLCLWAQRMSARWVFIRRAHRAIKSDIRAVRIANEAVAASV